MLDENASEVKLCHYFVQFSIFEAPGIIRVKKKGKT